MFSSEASQAAETKPMSDADVQFLSQRLAAENATKDFDMQCAFLRRARKSGRDKEAVEYFEENASKILGRASEHETATLLELYAANLREVETAVLGDEAMVAESVMARVLNTFRKGTRHNRNFEAVGGVVEAEEAAAGEGAEALASAARGFSRENPLFVSTIPSRWQAVGNIVYIAAVLGLVYYVFLRPANGGGGGLGNLMDQKDFTPVETNITTRFSDVRGSEEAKESVAELVDYLKFPYRFTRTGATLPKGVLLTGPPGCGKTLLARAVAGEAGVPFFFASGSEFEEMFVGVGARRVRNLFRKAKAAAPCIIFLDEIDAVGGRRDQNENKTKMTLNQLLVELDGFDENSGVLVIAATNLPEVLDPALIRPGRFDKQVLVDMPDVKARREILELYLGDPKAKTPPQSKSRVEAADDVDLDQLARSTMGFSGADIANMVNQAAIEAAKQKLTKVTSRLLDLARETISMGPARPTMAITPETKKITAYHESGHALIALLSEGVVGNEIIKATLLPRGRALGMVSYLPKDEMLRSKEAMLAELDIAMGGRVAEEMIFGPEKVTQGAGSDFSQATKTARRLVMEYGMSEEIGPIVISREAWRDASEELKGKVETEVRRLLDESYARASQLLHDNEKKLHMLAENLLKYETLDLEDIKLVVAGKDIASRRKASLAREQELIEQEHAQYGEGEDDDDDDGEDDEEDDETGAELRGRDRRPQPAALR
jgi:ATP-dependent metalloprotease FtsH